MCFYRVNGKCQIKAVHRDDMVDSKSPTNVAGKRFHFIGAGGVGMSGLAEMLIRNHGIVAGSDLAVTGGTDRLCQLGADIKIGHSPGNLSPETDVVVISAAIKEDNPELKLAQQRKCRIYKYAQMLGILGNRYDMVAVAGTHGKSTTSGWLTYLLKQAGLDPNFTIGADIIQLAASSGTGASRYFITEACEYDRSFLNLRPKIAAILNVEADHLDYYRDDEEIIEVFQQFALGLKPEGVLIANGQDTNVAKVISELPGSLQYETFGLNENCNFYARDITLNDGLYSFEVYHNSELLGQAKITIPGKHSILNALAVVAMATNVGLPQQQVLQLLPAFTGMDRRLMLKGKFNQITILDDYAHHPTEIRASLQAIRQKYQPKRIWCVFQPHQYSRTRFLLDDFAESFKFADVIIVPEIYFVRDSLAEKKKINSQILVDRIRTNQTEAVFIDSFTAICDYLQNNATADDLVVTMGAGDIWKVADEYIQRLRNGSVNSFL